MYYRSGYVKRQKVSLFLPLYSPNGKENKIKAVCYLANFILLANTKIIDSDDNWNLLLYKEAYHIKRSATSLNNGLKASRELC